MADNLVFQWPDHMSVICSNPTTPLSGGPVRWGYATGVALVDEGDGGNAAGYTTVDFGNRVWNLSVKAINDSGNSAVADGDPLFYVDADTPHISKKASGYFFGFAKAAITGGATATIAVHHILSPGVGTLASGGVGTTQLADGGVTPAKLSTNLAIGTIPLPLSAMRLIATNDIAAKNTTDGGLISLDTDPTFKRINGATDKMARISWAANSVVEILLGSFAYPPDLDDTADLIVHLIAKMAAGGMDTPVLTVSFFEGVGDTNAGGNTASLGTALADATRTILAADVGAAPNAATLGLIPGAHANEAVELYGAFVSYTRKA